MTERRPLATSRGFTILELIGVMAVIAILAGALAPPLFKLLDEGFQSAEAKSLDTIVAALEQTVRTTHQIPSANIANWTATVAQTAALSQQAVRLNVKNFDRRLYVDPNFFK